MRPVSRAGLPRAREALPPPVRWEGRVGERSCRVDLRERALERRLAGLDPDQEPASERAASRWAVGVLTTIEPVEARAGLRKRPRPRFIDDRQPHAPGPRQLASLEGHAREESAVTTQPARLA